MGSDRVDQREVRVHDGDARRWGRLAERDQGKHPGPTTTKQARIKELERELRELRQANETLRKASAYFAQAELDRRPTS